MNEPLTYATAGVNVHAGDAAVELMKTSIAATSNERVVSAVGGFAGLYDAANLHDYHHPILATSTDGVGTKTAIARALDYHDNIGFDLVGMVIDDLVVVGAEPLFMTDYIAIGKVVPEKVARIVASISRACQETSVPLIGGETAEHPKLLAPDEYDIAGAATGVVEAHQRLGPEHVRAGDTIIALASTGLHANGYSLVRAIVEHARMRYEQHIPELGCSLGEALLTPTQLYTPHCLALTRAFPVDGPHPVRAFSHITGGGIAANLARVIPADHRATIERSSWGVPRLMSVLIKAGGISQDEAEATFNMGVGMLAITSAEAAELIVRFLTARGIQAWVAGDVEQLPPTAAPSAPADAGKTATGTMPTASTGSVRLVGNYRGE